MPLKDGSGRPFFLIQCRCSFEAAELHRAQTMKHLLFAVSQHGVRLVSFGCLWSAVLGTQVLAQEAIYRCGQEYTNAPHDNARCERLSPQAVTVITGTRPAQNSPVAVTPMRPGVPPEGGSASVSRTQSESARPAHASQSERDAQARTIVSQELDKARQQLSQLVQEYNQGEPEKWASEARNHTKYLDRVAALKAAIERTERDIVSLQRELNRRPVLASSAAP